MLPFLIKEIAFFWYIESHFTFYEFREHCKPIPCNENRVFLVKFSHREIGVMKTGVPAMRAGVPCNENRFFPVWKTLQENPVLALYWPCTGLQCSQAEKINTSIVF